MSDHRRIPTHAEIARLTRTIRDGRLDDEQREQLTQLLDTIGSAVRVTPTMAARYPGQPERAAAAGLGCWSVASSSESTTAALDALSPRACRAEIEGSAKPGREARVTVASSGRPGRS
ncbi:MAG: hypothetical protein LC799_32325 [Actinobacteria bacterium]|nr:hypothetical protein [Actinomycetota bacterium]